MLGRILFHFACKFCNIMSLPFFLNQVLNVLQVSRYIFVMTCARPKDSEKQRDLYSLICSKMKTYFRERAEICALGGE